MAVVAIPYSMDFHMYSINGMDLVLPLDAIKENPYGQCLAISYEVEPGARVEFDGMVWVVGTIGIGLSAVIVLIGILNFINAVVTGIIARKRELAMLQSIGMINRQLKEMLIIEGIGYVGIAGVVSLIFGSILGWKLLSTLNGVIMLFEYRFQILPFSIILPLLMAVAVAGPWAAFHQIQKRSIVERLRETE